MADKKFVLTEQHNTGLVKNSVAYDVDDFREDINNMDLDRISSFSVETYTQIPKSHQFEKTDNFHAWVAPEILSAKQICAKHKECKHHIKKRNMDKLAVLEKVSNVSDSPYFSKSWVYKLFHKKPKTKLHIHLLKKDDVVLDKNLNQIYPRTIENYTPYRLRKMLTREYFFASYDLRFDSEIFRSYKDKKEFIENVPNYLWNHYKISMYVTDNELPIYADSLEYLKRENVKYKEVCTFYVADKICTDSELYNSMQAKYGKDIESIPSYNIVDKPAILTKDADGEPYRIRGSTPDYYMWWHEIRYKRRIDWHVLDPDKDIVVDRNMHQIYPVNTGNYPVVIQEWIKRVR